MVNILEEEIVAFRGEGKTTTLDEKNKISVYPNMIGCPIVRIDSEESDYVALSLNAVDARRIGEFLIRLANYVEGKP